MTKNNMGYLLVGVASFFTTQTKAQATLSLDEAIKQALQNSFDIQIAKNDEAIAVVSNSWALAGRLPTANANAGYNFSLTNLKQNLSNGTTTERDGATTRTLNSSVSGSWKIFNGFKVLATKKRLEVQQTLSEFQLKQQSNETVYNVIVQYNNLARLQLQIATLKQNLNLFKDRVSLAKARFEIGTTAKNDYLQSLVDFNEQQSNLLNLEGQLISTKTLFNNLLARDTEIPFIINEDVQITSLPNKAFILKNIDSLNPQLLAAKTNEAIFVEQHKEIKSQLYPTINLNAGAGFNRSNNSAGFTLLNQTLGPQGGITVAIPLFQGGIVKKQLRINDLQLKTAKTQTEQIRAALKTTMANAFNDYEFAKQQYNLQLQTLETVKENNTIATERFRQAAITLVEFRQVQNNLVDAQTNLINSRYNMKITEVVLQYLTGGFDQ